MSKVAEEIKAIIPPEQSVEGANTLTVSGRTLVLEKASNFKVLQVASILGKASEVIDADKLWYEVATIARTAQGQKVDPATVAMAFLRSVQMLAGSSPELLIDLAALLSLSNAELRAAFQGVPNSVKALVEARKSWLLWECEPGDPFRIIEVYLPTLGLEALKNALGPMLGRIGNLLPKAQGNGQGKTATP